MRIAVAQLNSTEDRLANRRACSELAARAADEGAKLLLLPECALYFGPSATLAQHAASLDAENEDLNFLTRLALKHNIDVLCGTVWERATQGRVYNTSVYLNAQGVLVTSYRKRHLFDADLDDGSSLRESTYVAAGTETQVVTSPAGVLGLAICFDLRFPAHFAELVAKGASLVAVPAAFTVPTGQAHWHVLLRARAIETQCYVLAPAQVGEAYPGRHTYGHALVVDPWGRIVAETQSQRIGLALADIDLPALEEIRRRMRIKPQS